MHTKGEWRAEQTKFGHWEIFTEQPNKVDIACAYLTQIEPETNGCAEANAHLIAAAPMLYEALRRIAIEGKRGDGKYDRYDARGFVRIAEDSIAEAEGRTE